MNKTIFLILFVLIVELFIPKVTQAQGIVYVSNLEQPPTDSMVFGSNAWIAQAFITGTNSAGYNLNSVQLLINALSGSPNGLAVSVYNTSSNPISPGSSIGNLNGTDPSTGGLVTYTASSMTLSPSRLYFVVVTSLTPVAQGAYTWSATRSDPAIRLQGWNVFGVFNTSNDGLNWQTSRNFDFQIGINATAVPEPPSLVLICCSAFFFGVHLFRHAKAKT